MEIKVNSNKYGSHTIYIDSEDFHLVKDIHWGIAKSKYKKSDYDVFYARGRVPKSLAHKYGQKNVRMHRIIMGLKKDEGIDHINHNGLDNRRNNLRLANQSQQAANTRLHADSLTGFKGLTYRKAKKLYTVRIRVNGKLINGGQYKNIYKAALKYNELAIKYFGEFACLNVLTDEQIKESGRLPKLEILKSNKTGYRGVSVLKNGQYAATIYVKSKNIGLGWYDSVIGAARAYNEAVIKYNKDSRLLNIIPNE